MRELAKLLFGHWAFDPISLAVVLAAGIYYVGSSRISKLNREQSYWSKKARRKRSISFYSSLVVVFIALASPIDYYSQYLFWVHMIQHILIGIVAPALLVLSAPWLVLLKGLPRKYRQMYIRNLFQDGKFVFLRKVAKRLNTPIVASVLFNFDFWIWHYPPLYDAALRNLSIHILEHTTFFGFGVLLWLQIVESYPFQPKWNYQKRCAMVYLSAVSNWILAIILGYASASFYPYYVNLVHRPGGISAIADQQLGAAIMWVPGMIPYTLAFAMLLYRWLATQEDPDYALQRLVQRSASQEEIRQEYSEVG